MIIKSTTPSNMHILGPPLMNTIKAEDNRHAFASDDRAGKRWILELQSSATLVVRSAWVRTTVRPQSLGPTMEQEVDVPVSLRTALPHSGAPMSFFLFFARPSSLLSKLLSQSTTLDHLLAHNLGA